MRHLIKSIVIIFVFILIFIAYRQGITSSLTKQKNIKLLYILQVFPEDVSTATLNQITGLIDRGIELDIYAKRKGNLALAHSDIHKYKLFDRTIFEEKHLNFDNYDIVFCQFGFIGFEFIPTIKKYNKKTLCVTSFRGADITKDMGGKIDKYRDLFKTGDYFLPVCNYFKSLLIELGCPKERIIVHHSAIDCNKFCYRERILKPGEPIRIITISRFIEKKGIQHSIRAVANLVNQFPNIEYNIVGLGPLENELKNLIETLGVSKNIRLVGHATQDRIATMLDESHIFVLASTTASNGDKEGIPNAVKEAMATGLPIVSTFHSGIPELVENGVSGILVNENDVQGLTDSIAYLINNPDIWTTLSRAGREKIEQEYETNTLNDQLFQFLVSLTIKK